MHQDLKNSGLGAALGISPVTTNMELAPFLGKVVRYKRRFQQEDRLKYGLGTITQRKYFLIKEVQRDWQGKPRLRGYCLSIQDDFGHVVNHEMIEVVNENRLLKRIYKAGQAARLADKALGRNPYPANNILNAEWARGWQDGC